MLHIKEKIGSSYILEKLFVRKKIYVYHFIP